MNQNYVVRIYGECTVLVESCASRELAQAYARECVEANLARGKFQIEDAKVQESVEDKNLPAFRKRVDLISESDS